LKSIVVSAVLDEYDFSGVASPVPAIALGYGAGAGATVAGLLGGCHDPYSATIYVSHVGVVIDMQDKGLSCDYSAKAFNPLNNDMILSAVGSEDPVTISACTSEVEFSRVNTEMCPAGSTLTTFSKSKTNGFSV